MKSQSRRYREPTPSGVTESAVLSGAMSRTTLWTNGLWGELEFLLGTSSSDGRPEGGGSA